MISSSAREKDCALQNGYGTLWLPVISQINIGGYIKYGFHLSQIIPHSIGKHMYLKEKIIHSTLIRNDTTNGCLSEMTLVVETLAHIYSENDQNCPNEMIACSGGTFWNFIQNLKFASSIR